MVKGLRGQTLDTVRDALDRWYKSNPERLQRPVLETIWFGIVVPALKRPNWGAQPGSEADCLQRWRPWRFWSAART
jgi:hypothetical protein